MAREKERNDDLPKNLIKSAPFATFLSLCAMKKECVIFHRKFGVIRHVWSKLRLTKPQLG